jgi:hypothetical protein
MLLPAPLATPPRSCADPSPTVTQPRRPTLHSGANSEKPGNCRSSSDAPFRSFDAQLCRCLHHSGAAAPTNQSLIPTHLCVYLAASSPLQPPPTIHRHVVRLCRSLPPTTMPRTLPPIYHFLVPQLALPKILCQPAVPWTQVPSPRATSSCNHPDSLELSSGNL